MLGHICISSTGFISQAGLPIISLCKADSKTLPKPRLSSLSLALSLIKASSAVLQGHCMAGEALFQFPQWTQSFFAMLDRHIVPP